jgi:heme-degrading monooxygenase HmoA
MAIVRLIFVTVKAQDAAAAERVWKTDCAPLMIKQKGCLSEELLKSTETPGEYISYAEWDSQASIERYLKSADHQTIKQHAAALRTESAPVVKCYTLV